jgi:hypothetical protein
MPIFKSLLAMISIAFLSVFFFAQTSFSAAIKVLTYNVCWECLSNSSKGSAGRLGALCNWTTKDDQNVTECSVNMAKTIDDASAAYGGSSIPYDFVGLQEAQHMEPFKEISAALKPLTMVDLNNSLVSFYDHNKYTLNKAIKGKFGAIQGSRGGRPILISIFNENIIFINLHAPHLKTDIRTTIEDALSETLISSLTSEEIKGLEHHRIIVTGDFNDHNGAIFVDEKNGQEFIPFRKAGIMTKVYLASENPVRTCCSNSVPYNSPRPESSGAPRVLSQGDYVFDSEPKTSFTSFKKEVPTNYLVDIPQSDHLPVIYFAQ